MLALGQPQVEGHHDVQAAASGAGGHLVGGDRDFLFRPALVKCLVAKEQYAKVRAVRVAARRARGRRAA